MYGGGTGGMIGGFMVAKLNFACAKVLRKITRGAPYIIERIASRLNDLL